MTNDGEKIENEKKKDFFLSVLHIFFFFFGDFLTRLEMGNVSVSNIYLEKTDTYLFFTSPPWSNQSLMTFLNGFSTKWTSKESNLAFWATCLKVKNVSFDKNSKFFPV